MKSCGLRKAYGMGGFIDPNSAFDTDAANAEKTARWAMDDMTSTLKNSISGRRALGGMLSQGQAGYNKSFMPQPTMSQSAVAQPVETTWQEDMDARQKRIEGYGAKLRGFAQGGTVDPDALMREMAAKYGTGGGQPAAPAPVAAPAPAPAPVAQAKPTLLDGLRRIATGGLDGRMKKAGFKQGGEVKEGGWIDGPKGVDKVPAKVAETGEDILVSHGERIVNKEQNKALEALAAQHGMSLDEYLEGATGEPVGPSMKKGLRAAENGASFMRVHQPGDRNYVDFNPAPAPNPARLSQGSIRQVDEFQPKEDPEALMQRIAKTRGIEYVPPSAPAAAAPEASSPTDPDTDGRRTYSPSMNSVFNNRGAETPVLAKGGNYSNEGRAVPKLVTAASPSPISTADRSLVDNTLGASAAIPQGLRSRYGAGDAMIKTQEVVSDRNLAKESSPRGLGNGTVNDGYGVVSIDQGNGKFKNVLMAPPEYTAADGSKTSDWSKTAQYAEGLKRAEADKQSLAQIQRERAEFDAFDPSITDPNVRANGLRKASMYMVQDDLARKALADRAKAQHDNLQLQLTKRGQDITLRGQENMQANSERDFKQKSLDGNLKDVNDWMDTMVPTAGLKDAELKAAQNKRAVLQQVMKNHWGGNMPTDRQAFLQAQPRMAREAEATMALYDLLGNQGWGGWIRNNGASPARTLQALSPKSYDQKGDVLTLADGYKVKGKELWGDRADMREALLARIGQ